MRGGGFLNQIYNLYARVTEPEPMQQYAYSPTALNIRIPKPVSSANLFYRKYERRDKSMNYWEYFAESKPLQK